MTRSFAPISTISTLSTILHFSWKDSLVPPHGVDAGQVKGMQTDHFEILL